MSDRNIEEMSFEDALKELELIVKKIDSGEENLDSGVAQFKRGSELKKHCQKKLEQARLVIEKVLQDGSLEEFDPENH